MASVIKISLLIVSALVFDTTPPSTPGDLFGQRLAPPLHGNLTPGRISVGRPPDYGTGREYHDP